MSAVENTSTPVEATVADPAAAATTTTDPVVRATYLMFSHLLRFLFQATETPKEVCGDPSHTLLIPYFLGARRRRCRCFS